jgi:hypothetical protein
MRKLGLLVLVACGPTTISGSNVPTEHTFELTEADIEAGASNECALAWIGSDSEVNRKKALDILAERRIRIWERNPSGFITSFPKRLWLTPDFSDKAVALQAAILSHELVHYCQRDKLGADFEADYLHSAGRWRLEVPAYAQQFRTYVAQGMTADDVAVEISLQVESLRTRYLLWDIDPEQYETETRRIWVLAAQ